MLAVADGSKREVVVPYMHARRIIGAVIVTSNVPQQLQQIEEEKL